MKEGFILKKDNFLGSVENTNSIYDFAILLFLQIEDNSIAQMRKDYCLFINEKGKSVKQIYELFDQLPSCNINTEFNDWIMCWISLISTMDTELSVLCLYTLSLIDNYLIEIIPNEKTLQNRGPFILKEKYAFYFTPPKSFFGDYFKENKIRDGRQKNIFDENSINCMFKNFMIINLESLGRYRPIITGYNVKNFCHDEINIGVSPINRNRWFEMEQNHVIKQFLIKYDNTKEQDHNNNIISIIRECSSRNLHFLILPELSMAANTEATLKNQIICNNAGVPKLLFLGSYWGETNEATLMTNSGTVLFKQKKSVPFKPFIKEKDVELIEPLQKNDTINFVDIPGVGRVVYLICADLKDDYIKMICNIMKTDFIIVSSFTEKTDIFETNAQSLASTNGVTTIICNSCAAITNVLNLKEKICTVFVPKVEAKKLIGKEFFSFDKSLCNKSDCSQCVKIFSINKYLS